MDLVATLGPDSAAYRAALKGLTPAFHRSADTPWLSTALELWRPSAEGLEVEDEAFLRETYLAVVARLIAARVAAPRADTRDPDLFGEVLSGDIFLNHDFFNLSDADPFWWVAEQSVAHLVDEALGPARDAAMALAPTALRHGQVLALHEAFRGPEDRPAGLGPWTPGRRLLDPACGAGSRLCGALEREQAARSDLTPPDVIEIALRVMGSDPDPLRAAIARTRYLVAFAETVEPQRMELAVPVYWSNLTLPPPDLADGQAGPELAMETPDGHRLAIPQALLTDLSTLNEVFRRLNQYTVAAARYRNEEDVDRSARAFGAFLVAPPTRRKPYQLSNEETQVMYETLLALARLEWKRRGRLWMARFKGHAAAYLLGRQRWDVRLPSRA